MTSPNLNDAWYQTELTVSVILILSAAQSTWLIGDTDSSWPLQRRRIWARDRLHFPLLGFRHSAVTHDRRRGPETGWWSSQHGEHRGCV